MFRATAPGSSLSKQLTDQMEKTGRQTAAYDAAAGPESNAGRSQRHSSQYNACQPATAAGSAEGKSSNVGPGFNTMW